MPAVVLIAQTGLAAPPLAERWWLFAGKLHPMLVHFPIALLIVAAALELLRRRREPPRWQPSSMAMTCLMIGAISAAFAAASGWSDAITSGHALEAVKLHRWLGVIAAAVALLTLLLAWYARWRQTQRLLAGYRVAIVLAAAGVGAAGHFGAALVHGDGYLTDALALLRSTSPVSSANLASSARLGDGEVDFTRDIRPIFARKCLSCHSGSDPAGGLDLDDRANLLAGGASRSPAIVPGDSARSRLMTLVTHGEGDLKMPPKGAPLDAAQVAILARWIDQGAKWTGADDRGGSHWHWAYAAPQRPNIPAVRDTNWPANAIDHFILAQLEREGLAPSPRADRAALVRRLSLDLIGLPPSPDEVREFINDPSPHAYEALIDRLLASPHYGERLARPWLDLARYADTHGYEKDDRRVMWPWRDWVIHAFNSDMPFDQFTIEQLAGDLLPEPTLDQLIATGFNRNSMINEEGGVDPEEFRVEAVIDRVNTFGSVWLGSTISCAQCHDHKFDPFTQRDYFSLFAVFNQDQADATRHATGATAGGPMIDVPRTGDRARYDELTAAIGIAQARLADSRAAAITPESLAAWERTSAQREPAWTVLAPLRIESIHGTTFDIATDASVRASGPTPEKDSYTIIIESDLPSIAALRLDVMPDDSTPAKAVGRSPHGNIVLSDVRVEVLSDAGGNDSARPVAIVGAAADFEQPRTFGGGGFWPIADSIDDNPDTGGWAVGPQTQQSHAALFAFAQPITRSEGESVIRLRITLAQNYGNQHTLAKFRLSATAEADALALRPLSPEIQAIIALAADQRTSEQQTQLADHYESVAPELASLRANVLNLQREQRALIAARAMIMRAEDKPRETFIHVGGNFLNPGERVAPNVPAILPPLPPESESGGPPHDRLALARWLVDPAHPLTARVQVNRLWELLFGRGIIATSDDFGTQGDAAVNPEQAQLLDWLATDFMRDGWSIKRLLKTMVMSETYQQSSRITPEMLERDPQNLLLARGPRFRVEAETVRDIALAASGLLCSDVGGPSVFPPQPDGIWTMIYSSDAWTNSTGDDAHRRGLYTFWRRTAPYPAFVTFDAPSRELACTRRARTNTPLQALTTLNDPAYVDASNALAKRMLAEGGGDDRARIEYGFTLCVSRSPSPAEMETVIQLLNDERTAYAADIASAEKFAGAKGEQSIDLAAWKVVANVLLNLDETITRE